MRWEYPINSDIQLFGLIVKIKKKKLSSDKKNCAMYAQKT